MMSKRQTLTIPICVVSFCSSLGEAEALPNTTKDGQCKDETLPGFCVTARRQRPLASGAYISTKDGSPRNGAQRYSIWQDETVTGFCVTAINCTNSRLKTQSLSFFRFPNHIECVWFTFVRPGRRSVRATRTLNVEIESRLDLDLDFTSRFGM